MPDETIQPKKSKIPSALMMFLIVGLAFNTLLNYSQSNTIQDTNTARAVISDETLENSKINKERLERIEALLIAIQTDLNAQKAGKTVK